MDLDVRMKAVMLGACMLIVIHLIEFRATKIETILLENAQINAKYL